VALSRTWLIASAEFEAAIRSKAFIIGLLAVPALMGVAFMLQLFGVQRDTSERTFAVVDRTGVLAPRLVAEAETYNREGLDDRGVATRAQFVPRVVDAQGRSVDEIRLALSDEVRAKTLFAFVELPAGLLEPGSEERLQYFSQSPTYQALPEWLGETVSRLTTDQRITMTGSDPDAIRQLLVPVRVDRKGLVMRDARGEVAEAQRVDALRALALPAISMFMLFGLVMTSAPQLLNSVIEEKTSRISEVLLGSVPAFTLMLGKLLGSVAVTLLLALLYVGGGLLVAAQFDYFGVINWMVVPWFLLFLVVAVVLYGSMFIAIGAACSEVKDAQGMMTPALVIGMLPIFLWLNVAQNPDSTYSVLLSLFPFATPYLMLLRIAIPPGPPLWQILLGLVLVGLTTAGMVWVAGRILRVGLLMQGKTASYREMARWVRAE
jgi:ABC-2 type transport system permease protein